MVFHKNQTMLCPSVWNDPVSYTHLPDALSYDYGENEEMLLSMYPIRCIRISPLSKKFSETLTHRDYLGALIHLGIERSRLGDIEMCIRDSNSTEECDGTWRQDGYDI